MYVDFMRKVQFYNHNKRTYQLQYLHLKTNFGKSQWVSFGEKKDHVEKMTFTFCLGVFMKGLKTICRLQCADTTEPELNV